MRCFKESSRGTSIQFGSARKRCGDRSRVRGTRSISICGSPILSRREHAIDQPPSTLISNCFCLSLGYARRRSIVCGWRAAGNCQSPLDHNPVGGILVAHGLLRQKQAFETYGVHGNAIEIHGLTILTERIVGMPVRIEHDVDNKDIRDADIVTFLKPFRFQIRRRLICRSMSASLTLRPVSALAGNTRSISVVARW